jgi:hypothetical protein
VYTWGRIPEKPDHRAADATGNLIQKPRKGAYKLSLDEHDSITKMTFEQMFEKVVMHSGIRNAIMLLGQYSKRSDFSKHYNNDPMTATFEVLQYQREFLYQTFNNIPGKEGTDKLFKKKTME